MYYWVLVIPSVIPSTALRAKTSALQQFVKTSSTVPTGVQVKWLLYIDTKSLLPAIPEARHESSLYLCRRVSFADRWFVEASWSAQRDRMCDILYIIRISSTFAALVSFFLHSVLDNSQGPLGENFHYIIFNSHLPRAKNNCLRQKVEFPGQMMILFFIRCRMYEILLK